MALSPPPPRALPLRCLPSRLTSSSPPSSCCPRVLQGLFQGDHLLLQGPQEAVDSGLGRQGRAGFSSTKPHHQRPVPLILHPLCDRQDVGAPAAQGHQHQHEQHPPVVGGVVDPQVRYLQQVRNGAGYGFVQFHAAYNKSLATTPKLLRSPVVPQIDVLPN